MRGVNNPIFQEIMKDKRGKDQFYAVLDGVKETSDNVSVDGDTYRFKRDGGTVKLEKVVKSSRSQ